MSQEDLDSISHSVAGSVALDKACDHSAGCVPHQDKGIFRVVMRARH